LSAGYVLYAVSEAGLTLTTSKTKDTLKVFPAKKLTPELAREHFGPNGREGAA
jgi:hypothetical protein